MSSNYLGNLKISIFGQSHSGGIGVVIDGLPAGVPVDMEALSAFLARRAPGRNPWSTPRREADAPEFLSGLADGVTCGAPLCAIMRNTNTRSGDYANLRDIPRPGHADFTAQMRYGGYQDVAGGGHFSGRLTAPLCIAGSICAQILARRGIRLGAHLLRVGQAWDRPFDPLELAVEELCAPGQKPFPVLDDRAGLAMQAEISAAREAQDSVGGMIECAALGLPAGIGDPMFDGMENRIARIVFAIPAVKGLEFGAGMEVAGLRGSENNDAYQIRDGRIATRSNRAGGILGGITNGMPLIFRAAVKPTPSIGRAQRSVSLSRMEETTLEIRGRHDPCIAPRAVPCMEAALAIALLDALLEKDKVIENGTYAASQEN